MTFRVLGNFARALRASTALACGIYSHRAGFYCFLERNSMRDSVQGRVQWVLPLCHATNTWRLTHTGMTVAQICRHFMVKIYKCVLQWYRWNIRFASKVMDIFLNQLITFYWNNTTNLRPNPLNEARDDGFGMQWQQLDQMQTNYTSLQTDNHTNTSSLNLQAGCSSWRRTNSVKAPKAFLRTVVIILLVECIQRDKTSK